jgi:death-on-curing protein
VIARLFLAGNGYRLQFDKVDAVRTVEGLAAGRIDEQTLAERFLSRLVD